MKNTCILNQFVCFCLILLSSFASNAQMRVIIKETSAVNIELPKPANIQSKKDKLYYSLIEVYFENSGKLPEKMAVFFEGQTVVSSAVSTSETLSYVSVRNPQNDVFSSNLLYEPQPGKYTFTIYTETQTLNLKNSIRVFVDDKAVKTVFKFATAPILDEIVESKPVISKPQPEKKKKNGKQ